MGHLAPCDPLNPRVFMIGYLDMPSGISGDMFLGCLVDAGWPLEELHQIVQRLDLQSDHWQIECKQVHRGALRATLVDVHVTEQSSHRFLNDILETIDGSGLSTAVKAKTSAVFTRLAEAEARVHGIDVDLVHFHEVGALDAIIDIVGVVAGLNALGVERLYASGLPLGEGWTRAAHGQIPLPAPATLQLLTGVQAPSRTAPGPGELVTPTGAALVAELAEFRQPSMCLEQVAYGAGQKEFEWPNVARLWLGSPLVRKAEFECPTLVQMETNIDDMNPELYGSVRRQLYAAGALDVWTVPVQMKKERPGVLLCLLAPQHLEASLAAVVLRETTTLGVRVHCVHRHEAARQFRVVESAFGDATVKVKILDGKVADVKPEYECCVQLAATAKVPVRVVLDEVRLAARHLFQEPLSS